LPSEGRRCISRSWKLPWSTGCIIPRWSSSWSCLMKQSICRRRPLCLLSEWKISLSSRRSMYTGTWIVVCSRRTRSRSFWWCASRFSRQRRKPTRMIFRSF
jgi:hypothetical protein